MSHEKTITIKVGEKWHNIKTVVSGKTISDPKARAHAVKTKTLGKAFGDVDSAVAAAKKRSESFNKKKKTVKKKTKRKPPPKPKRKNK